MSAAGPRKLIERGLENLAGTLIVAGVRGGET